jgi:hypothetical protein
VAHVERPATEFESEKFFPPVERRNAIRYRLDIPVVFRWQDGSGIRLNGEGVTRDVSEVGAYVFTARCPPLQTEVEIEIVVPPLHGAPKAWLKGIMQVLRVEAGPGGEGGFSLAGKALIISPAEQFMG